MSGYLNPANYWGVSPQTASTFPLGLRTSNNLFNIKYYPGAERNQAKWPGLLGPSSARDEGDAQMLFANPEDSGVAGAMLLRRKYDAGQKTPQQIIAGPSGWTPGRTDSANAVASYAGVNPSADLKLDTPEGMRRFLPALATQEHGTWARDKLFSDDLFDKIGERATGAQFASGALPQLAPLDLETGANAHRWPDGPKAPMAQPMTAPASQQPGPQPMADPYAQPQPDESPFNSFLTRFQSPMTQQGLGLLLSAMQGGDLNQGLTAGAQRGQMAFQQQQQQMQMRQAEAKRQAIEQMLSDPNSMQGVPPALVNLARATRDVDPVAQYLVKSSVPPSSDDIKEYEYAKKTGFTGSFVDWMGQKKQHQGEYAKQLVYGTDAAGNIVPMQAGSKGDLVASKMPQGVSLQRDPIKVETATGTALIDPTTRTQIGFIPKSLAQAEVDKGLGETIAKARSGLPVAENTFQTAKETLDKIRSHPGLDWGVGAPSYIPPFKGTEIQNFATLVDQAKGGAFMQAVQGMRGLGALTEQEGKAATAAIARMDRAQSKAAFLDALKDYESLMERGLAVQRRLAAVGQDLSQQPQLPQRGLQPAQGGEPSPSGWDIRKVE